MYTYTYILFSYTCYQLCHEDFDNVKHNIKCNTNLQLCTIMYISQFHGGCEKNAIKFLLKRITV